jgi:hypothetical protein
MYGEDQRTYVPVSRDIHAQLVQLLQERKLGSFDELLRGLISGPGPRAICGVKGRVNVGGKVREVSCRLREISHEGLHAWWSKGGVRRTF